MRHGPLFVLVCFARHLYHPDAYVSCEHSQLECAASTNAISHISIRTLHRIRIDHYITYIGCAFSYLASCTRQFFTISASFRALQVVCYCSSSILFYLFNFIWFHFVLCCLTSASIIISRSYVSYVHVRTYIAKIQIFALLVCSNVCFSN